MEKFNSVVLRFALFAAVTIHLCDMPAVGRQGNALPADKEFTNSIGMKFVRVEPGRFRMGSEDADLPPEVLVANEADGGTVSTQLCRTTMARPGRNIVL